MGVVEGGLFQNAVLDHAIHYFCNRGMRPAGNHCETLRDLLRPKVDGANPPIANVAAANGQRAARQRREIASHRHGLPAQVAVHREIRGLKIIQGIGRVDVVGHGIVMFVGHCGIHDFQCRQIHARALDLLARSRLPPSHIQGKSSGLEHARPQVNRRARLHRAHEIIELENHLRARDGAAGRRPGISRHVVFECVGRDRINRECAIVIRCPGSGDSGYRDDVAFQIPVACASSVDRCFAG